MQEENLVNLTLGNCQNRLKELEPLLACQVNRPEFISKKQPLYFLKARYHEQLNEAPEAWRAYCAVSDKKHDCFTLAVTARATLLKRFIQTQFDAEPIPPSPDSAEGKAQPKKEKTPALTLPNGIPFSTHFSSFWSKDTTWFHSVNEQNLNKKFDTRLEQIKLLIKSKKQEHILLQEFIKEHGEATELKEIKETLEREIEALKNIKDQLNEQHTNHHPNFRKTFRRHATERHFFNPSRSQKSKELLALTEKIIDQRFSISNDENDPVILTGTSTRLLITAERIFQEAVIALSGTHSQLGIPVSRQKPWSINQGWGPSGTTDYGPVENYQVGDTIIKIEHRADPKSQRLGDSFFPQLGTYSSNIFPFLKKISNDGDSESEQNIAKLMIQYSRTHQPIALETLQDIYKEAEKEDVDHFNRICCLIMSKEQGQWHSASSPDFQLGMSVSQARCLIMIEAGFLSFEEAFKNNAIFGVYSHTGLANSCEDVAKSCRYIDDLYLVFLQAQHQQDYVRFFKSHVKAPTAHTIALTRTQAHQDLQYIYGGGSDTDGEGYDSDLSFDETDDADNLSNSH